MSINEVLILSVGWNVFMAYCLIIKSMHINDLRDDLKMIKEEIIEFRNFIING